MGTDTKSDGTRLPKHFKQPLTCFYWHNYGNCTKSDDACWYAHYDTGIVAAAPVSLKGGHGAMAGRNALTQLDAFSQRERRLQAWEARLQARQVQQDIRQVQQNSMTSEVSRRRVMPAFQDGWSASMREMETQAYQKGICQAHADKFAELQRLVEKSRISLSCAHTILVAQLKEQFPSSQGSESNDSGDETTGNESGDETTTKTDTETETSPDPARQAVKDAIASVADVKADFVRFEKELNRTFSGAKES